MKKPIVIALTVCTFIFALAACQKSVTSDNAITVERLGGTYALKSLIWNNNGIIIDVYNALDACERDNLTQFNTDKTFNVIDAGVTCDPPSDDNGKWELRNDSIIVSGGDNAKIESFDGKTLVLSGNPDGDPGVIGTTTLVKQ